MGLVDLCGKIAVDPLMADRLLPVSVSFWTLSSETSAQKGGLRQKYQQNNTRISSFIVYLIDKRRRKDPPTLLYEEGGGDK